MTSEIVGEKKEVEGIDWDKSNILESNRGIIVLSTGVHRDNSFSGVVLLNNMVDSWEVGHYSEMWGKNLFTLITEPLTIIFKP